MKTKFILLFFLAGIYIQCAHGQSRKKSSSLVKVKGTVTSTNSYCGGAQPPEELLQDLKSPKPMSGKVILVKMGKVNSEKCKVVKKLITNDKGEFEVMLKKGRDYIFIEEWKGMPYKLPKNTEWIKWDAECYKKSYQTPDYVLHKANRTSTIPMNFHIRCSFDPYCGQYSGPLPP